MSVIALCLFAVAAALLGATWLVIRKHPISNEPLSLSAEEKAVLRKLRDDEGLSDVRLIRLVRERHRTASLVAAKNAVDRL